MEFTYLHVIFLAIAGFTLLCGLGVVVSRNLFHSAIWLIGAFAGVAAIYWLLEAEYLAIAQIMIYIGAIATLIVFAIMLSRGMMIGRAKMNNFQAGISAVVDGNGRLLRRAPKRHEQILVADLARDGRYSFYRQWGDLAALVCLAITAGWMIQGSPLFSRFSRGAPCGRGSQPPSEQASTSA